MYQTNHNVDYITFSTTKYIHIDDLFGKHEPAKPRIGNYKQARLYECGTFVQWDDKQPRMKQHVTLSGETLAKYRKVGISDIELINHLASLKKPKFGRIDIAVTAWKDDNSDMVFTPEYVYQLCRNGKLISALQPDKPIVDTEKNVETMYIGRRDLRTRLLRVYDKGLELGQEANKIIRIELETRGKEPCAKIAKEVAHGTNIAGMIRRYVDLDDKVFDDIMQCPAIPRDRVDYEDKQKDFELDKKINWLMTSVAPALANIMLRQTEAENDAMINQFMHNVTYHMHKISEKLEKLDKI